MKNKIILLVEDNPSDVGLTQRALGKRMGKPQSWVYNCETANRRVDVTEFLLWCRACDVDPHAALRRLAGEAG